MSEQRDYERIARLADLVVMYAKGAALRNNTASMQDHEEQGVERSLKNLASATGYRLVPANDREAEDA